MKLNMKRQTHLKTTIAAFLIALALSSFELSPSLQAVSPAPDGGYPGGNTAEGQSALLGLTSGSYNTALGYLSLASDTFGTYNTAVGAGALLSNNSDQNTATGAAALLSNSGFANTADGAFALFFNTGGAFNTGIGWRALSSNSQGLRNTAVGGAALSSNTSGADNTACGHNALQASTGDDNIAVGAFAGSQQTTGSNNVYIGFNMQGVAGENGTCYIASIFNQPSPNGVPVLINSSNKLGTSTSSKRFKQDIKPMDKVSEALFALKPVTFHYKQQFDPAKTMQMGLVAEDVEKVNADLIVRDKDGKPYSVRYDQVNAMLLNEFLKEHKTVQELKKEVATLTATVKEQSSQVQKIKAQLGDNKQARQFVLNNQ